MSGDSQSLASSRNRRSSEPASWAVRKIELSTDTIGKPAAAIVCFSFTRFAAEMEDSISCPSMSRSSTPA
jgi:hypothetical protein